MRLIYFLTTMFCFMSVSLTPQENEIKKDSVHIISIKKKFSKNYTGWKLSYTEFKDNLDEFIIPFTFSFEGYKLKPEIFKEKRITSLDTYALGIGFDGYQKLTKGCYLNLGLNAPIGMEVIKNLNGKRKRSFLIGIEPKIGLKFITDKDLGFVIGGNTFWKFSNSKVLNNGIGFEIELGINF